MVRYNDGPKLRHDHAIMELRSIGGKGHQSRNQTKGCNNVAVIGVMGERYIVLRELITRETDLLMVPEESSLRS